MKTLSTTLHPQDIVPWSLNGLQCETQTEHRLATRKHLRLYCLYIIMPHTDQYAMDANTYNHISLISEQTNSVSTILRARRLYLQHLKSVDGRLVYDVYADRPTMSTLQ